MRSVFKLKMLCMKAFTQRSDEGFFFLPLSRSNHATICCSERTSVFRDKNLFAVSRVWKTPAG